MLYSYKDVIAISYKMISYILNVNELEKTYNLYLVKYD